MNNNQLYKVTVNDSNIGRSPSYDSTWSGYGSYSASLVAEERGYVLGVEDERKKYLQKISMIIINLKARGYPLLEIAQDTGFTVDEIASFR